MKAIAVVLIVVIVIAAGLIYVGITQLERGHLVSGLFNVILNTFNILYAIHTLLKILK